MADEVQRVSHPMTKGVASLIDISRLEELISRLENAMVEIKKDYIPAANANLHMNRDFQNLFEMFNAFKVKYGIEPKDMDLDQNPQYAALENRVDVVEKIGKDLQAEMTAIKRLLNPAP